VFQIFCDFYANWILCRLSMKNYQIKIYFKIMVRTTTENDHQKRLTIDYFPQYLIRNNEWLFEDNPHLFTILLFAKTNLTITNIPGKPSSDTHDQIRKITLKTTTAKTTTFNRKNFGICLREKTMTDYVICTVIPKVIITWYHTCHTVGLTGSVCK
jgi:hypothetical protein